jgi:2'-5' RNA ligase
VANALVLLFDPQTDAAVRAVWANLEARGVSSLATATHGRHHPHVSLAVADRIGHEQARAAIEPLRDASSMHLRLGSLAVFPGRAGVLYLGVVPTLRLLRVHHLVHERLARSGVETNRHYLPDAWVPHCTLAQGLTHDAVTTGVRAIKRLRPLEADGVAVGLADTGTGEVTTLLDLPLSVGDD